MKKIDNALTQTARAAILAHGFDAAIADLVEVTLHPAQPDFVEHAEIRWSYPATVKGKAKQVEVAISFAPSDTLDARLSAESIADTVIAIRPTLPVDLRQIELPTWALARGERIRGAMGRARSLSQNATQRLAA